MVSAAPFGGAAVGLAAGCGLLLVLTALLGPAPARRARRRGPIARLASEAGLVHVSTASILGAGLLCGVVAGILALILTALPAVAIIAAMCASLLPVVVLRRRAAARRRALTEGWPDAIDSLVSAVRAGMSLAESVSDLGRSGPAPLRSAFAAFATEYRASGSFSDALDLLQGRLADPVADRVVAALRLAREFGGTDLGVVLRTLSTMLREDARARGEIQARQSWTVAAARMAVAAPWLTLALLCTRPEAVAAYTTPAGTLVLGVAAALSVVAYRAMMRIGRLPREQRIAA